MARRVASLAFIHALALILTLTATPLTNMSLKAPSPLPSDSGANKRKRGLTRGKSSIDGRLLATLNLMTTIRRPRLDTEVDPIRR